MHFTKYQTTTNQTEAARIQEKNKGLTERVEQKREAKRQEAAKEQEEEQTWSSGPSFGM